MPKKKPIGKYQNKQWLKLRSQVFKRDGNKCKKCTSSECLQCHHEYYIFGRKIWEYPITAFITLCKICHEKFHTKTKGRELVRKATDEEKKWYNSKFKKKLIPKPKKRNPRK